MIVLAVALAMQNQKSLGADFLAPTPDCWIQGPTSRRALLGKVVLIDYWDYTCNNCERTHAYLREWYRRYHDKGLEIVSVHTGEFDFETNPAKVRAAVKREGMTWHILNDPKKLNRWQFGVLGWPERVLYDIDGQMQLMQLGEGHYGNMEKAIQKEIARLHPGTKFPPLMQPVRPTDKPDAVCRPMTPEIYTWIKGIPGHHVVFGSKDIEVERDYSFPAKRDDDVVYLSGRWLPSKHFLVAKAPGCYLLLKYRAKEVNIVVNPSAPLDVEVMQDGKPVAKRDLGDDVKLVNGRSIMHVDSSRMYSVLKNHEWANRELTLCFSRPTFSVYSLSFSTDCVASK